MEQHFTVTTYILDESRVLLIKHPKYHKWLPPGGHLELNELPPEGAKREVKEETGLEITFLNDENIWIDEWNAKSFERPYLCLLEIIKDDHLHMDMIYVAVPSGGTLIEDETIKWFTLEEVLALESDVEIFNETKKTIKHLCQKLFSSHLRDKMSERPQPV